MPEWQIGLKNRICIFAAAKKLISPSDIDRPRSEIAGEGVPRIWNQTNRQILSDKINFSPKIGEGKGVTSYSPMEESTKRILQFSTYT